MSLEPGLIVMDDSDAAHLSVAVHSYGQFDCCTAIP